MSGIENIIILLLTLIIFLANLRIHHDVTAPAVLLSVIWMFVELFSFISAPDYFFSFNALVWIQVLLLLFSGGAALAKNRVLKSASENTSLKWVVRLQFLCLLAAPMATLSMIRDCGMGFPSSAGEFIELTQRLTAGRFSGEHLSMITMGFLTLTYIGCLNGGMLAVKSEKLIMRIFGIAILPLLLGFTVVYTARATFLFGFLFFVSSFLMSLAGKGNINAKLLTPKSLRWLVVSCFSIVLIFLSTQLLRSGDGSVGIDKLKAVSNHLKVWFSGNLSGYSYWFDIVAGQEAPKAGMSIAGLVELCGGVTRKPGIYQMAYDASRHQEWTNIFTLFRYLMDDLGTIGTLFLLSFLGWISTALYQRVKEESLVAIGLLSGIIAALLFSFVTSIMAYNTVLFAWIGFSIFLSLQEKSDAQA
jgi:oligosaccharide repeat unit polymerase